MPTAIHGYSEVALTQLRRELHKYPELSGEEVQTAIRIVRVLSSLKPDLLVNKLGGTGIAAVFEGKNPGPAVMFRCEMDALPIEENNPIAYKSVKSGVGHLCGHDGHMAIMCGIASVLGVNRPEKGKVILLFQPAEETGAGAMSILQDPRFAEITPDFVIAMHNLPGYRKGEVILKEGTFTASVNSIVIRLRGQKAHAAEPMMGNNPANAVAGIIETLRRAENRNPGSPDFSLTTPVYIRLGSIAYGVSADDAELHYTLRASTEANLRKLEAFSEGMVRETATAFGLGLELEWTQRFIAVENHKALTDNLKEAALEAGYRVTEPLHPFSWGEDFGYFTAKYPGVLFGIGAGLRIPSLHQSDYDFPDDLIGIGVELYKSIISRLLQ
jgi:amidohydrolase